ncbi:MAG: Gfo/Idh/MocA family oxidoreductase, partial [Tannerella sp.]|nr:Gfo/Idh/MocA family oxidoreductase [Tannerella sp.]
LGKSHGYTAPSDKLNIAGVGIGGMGSGNLGAVEKTENIVALCDVDWKYSKHVFDRLSGAKKYKDFRLMYDELGKDIDAVIVATADHTHAIIASTGITLGKHVYVQKPLTHSVYESRLLTKLAAKHNIASQMGNQGSSGEGVSQICEYIWNGGIGEITKVECATNRPIWPQGLNTPEKASKVPATLDWDLFTGPAEVRPYNEIYHPWNWRGWWPYGTGALGDMACHIVHPVFKALKLGYPIKAEGSSTLLLKDCAPTAQHVKLIFPARENLAKVALPEVEVHWYDGGLLPDRPAGFPQGRALMPGDGGLVIFHGTKDTLLCECYGKNPWLISGRKLDAPKTLRRISTSHEMDWVRACKESPANRVKTASDFSEAGPFNEMVVMGVLAVRLQGLNKVLDWDGPNMKFTNIGADEKITTILKDDFKVVDGHPSFNKPSLPPVNAQEFAAELINHKYRDGWSLPAMP